MAQCRGARPPDPRGYLGKYEIGGAGGKRACIRALADQRGAWDFDTEGDAT